MQSNQDLARAIEAIKARVSLEEVVRECTTGDFVMRSHRLWCNCPLHDEDTPSFAIQPEVGLWYCFGACGEGGDLIQFVQRRHNMSFWDSLEYLAGRAGVELPRRNASAPKDDPAYRVLKDAEAFYQSQLQGPEGKIARDYLRKRGISEGAITAFGLGYSPQNGHALTERAQRGTVLDANQGLDLAIACGLVRKNDAGRAYDFFRGRLMIPIRDDRGRTVGFGARRIDAPSGAAGSPSEAPEGPKYYNTPETPWFHKGRVIYGYDRAAEEIRRSGHMVLMEGYTDVICAHQAGFRQACAVLGTATTEHHARLARRTGTRRITLLFDGDEAGRKAAWKALEGLLPLEVDLDVAVPPAGKDPADLVAGGDVGPLMALLEHADPWMDFVLQSLKGLTGRPLSLAVDRILELLGAIPKPVHQEACLQKLAEETGLPVASLRLQRDQLPERRRIQSSLGGRAGDDGAGAHNLLVPNAEKSTTPVDPRVRRAYRGLIGAALCDTSLIPRVRPLMKTCEIPAAKAVLETMIQLWDSDDPEAPVEITLEHILNALGDHPVRGHLAGMIEYVRQAEDIGTLLENELTFLDHHATHLEKKQLEARVKALESQVDFDSGALAETMHCLRRLHQLNQQMNAAHVV